jgi:hypothetical protein
MCADASEIFAFLRSNSIGQGFALFYEAWAAVLERKDDYAMAEQVRPRRISRCEQHYISY